MFGNLFKEAEAVASRSSNLQARIDRLAIRVTQLDSTVEEGKKIHHFYILPNTLKQCSQKWAREFFQGCGGRIFWPTKNCYCIFGRFTPCLIFLLLSEKKLAFCESNFRVTRHLYAKYH